MSLIVLEGLDGSGKRTQTGLLHSALLALGHEVREVSFPDYAQPSSALVKMYLNGAFGGDPCDVGAYAASAFYAVDRYASYRQFWQPDYLSGKTILADRYTTSNMIYQLDKLPRGEWDGFLLWLRDFEYGKLGLPAPDLVLYLDMPTEISQRLLAKRYLGDTQKKDIHERDVAFLRACRESALYVAARQGWRVIPCADGAGPLPVEEIQAMILQQVTEVLKPVC